MRTFAIAPAVLCLALCACSANPTPSGDGEAGEGSGGTGMMPTGGTGPTGGTAPTGGTSPTGGTGGTTTQPIPGGPYPFPQNRPSGQCQITNHPSAAAAVQTAYDYFKQQFVVPASPGLRVRRPTNGDDTVSEGVAYGMLAAVYMNDRPVFDGIWEYVQSKFDQNGLMHWRINPDGTVASDGSGSATDADEDFAWALIMASAQWQSGEYLDAAKRMINAMYTHNVGADGMLLPGDGWGSTDRTYPNYFSPAYFRVFATLTNNRNWSGVIIDKNYEILEAVGGQYGLAPDWTTRTYMHTTNYSYDACRTPWRIAMDWCFHGEPRARAYLDKVGNFFNSQLPVTNFADGYTLTGQKAVNYVSMAFIGTAGVAGMAGWPQLLNDAFTYGATGTGGNTQYYQQSLRLMTMLMMSGNFLDYTQLGG